MTRQKPVLGLDPAWEPVSRLRRARCAGKGSAEEISAIKMLKRNRSGLKRFRTRFSIA
jgi:hypothetical protein